MVTYPGLAKRKYGKKSCSLNFKTKINFMRIIDLLFLFSLWTNLLSADLEDHLKEASNKYYPIHNMRNIDFIYLINLDQRPEKLKLSMNQFAPYGIYPYRFSAVNGWQLSLETINDVGLKFTPEMEGGFMATSYHLNGNFEPSHETIRNLGQTYFCHCMSRGAIGIALSHISILQDAYDSEYKTIWVMEDDVEVIQNPNILSELIDKLDLLVGKDHWDILFTDKDIRDANGNHKACYWAAKRPDFMVFSQINNYSGRTKINDDFWKIGARWGAHSMIIRRSGIKKLLQFFKAHQIFLPYDMDYILPPGINLYTVAEDVVSNFPNSASDNGGPAYLNKK